MLRVIGRILCCCHSSALPYSTLIYRGGDENWDENWKDRESIDNDEVKSETDVSLNSAVNIVRKEQSR